MMQNRLGRILFKSYDAVPNEVDCTLEIVEGKCPEELKGILYRNYPGLMERGGVYYGHPFDGDGMISKFEFVRGRIYYTNRMVRTDWFKAEEAAGRILFRNFGTNIPGGFLKNVFRFKFKNAANTSIVFHGEKLLALWEGGAPHELNPATLDTTGIYDYQGVLLNRSLFKYISGAHLPFSAHPAFDPHTGGMYNFGVYFGVKPELLLYRVDTKGEITLQQRVFLDSMGFMHDSGLTENWRVFFLCPLSFNITQMILGLKPSIECAYFDKKRKTQIILIPRDGGEPVKMNTDPGFVFHFANAYEDEGGRIVIDGPLYDRFPEFIPVTGFAQYDFTRFPKMLMTRFIIDPGNRTVSNSLLSDYPAELPKINPGRKTHKHRYIWASAASSKWAGPFLTGVSKIDAEAGKTVFRDFSPNLTSEPMFVQRPGPGDEDNGWLILPLYVADEHNSDLLVLDASDLSTVCRARLPHNQPQGYHGSWVRADK